MSSPYLLVINNIAAAERSLVQVIGQLLLLDRQLIEARHLVAQQLEIGKAFGGHPEGGRCIDMRRFLGLSI